MEKPDRHTSKYYEESTLGSISTTTTTTTSREQSNIRHTSKYYEASTVGSSSTGTTGRGGDRHTSKYYEASTVGSTSSKTSKASTAKPHCETITLQDLRESIAKQPGRHSTTFGAHREEWSVRKTPEKYGDWRQRMAWGEEGEESDDFPEQWPKPPAKREDPAPEYKKNKDPVLNDVGGAPVYNTNFLHPPTPSVSIFPEADTDNKEFNDTTSLKPRRASELSSRIERSSRFGWWTICLLVLGIIMVTLTAIYASGAAKNLMRDRFFTTSSSNSILIVRILTECCAVILAGLAVVVVEDLQWALASRPEGVSLLHFVGLDGGTGAWGLVRLLATAEWKQKYSSLFRLMVLFSIPLPGIILMGSIAIELVYFPEETYEVAAGIAEFNSSLVYQLDSVYSTALLVSMGSPAWSARESIAMATLGPGQGKCTSTTDPTRWAPCEEAYLMTGGIVSISPQADDLKRYPNSAAYRVPKTRTVQIEYGGVHDTKKLHDNGYCTLIGSASAAAYWCASTGSDQELLFGSSYCPLALQATGSCFKNTTWTSPLQLATSIFVYKRYATINYSRTNFTILSVSDMSEPVQSIIKLEDYMIALSAMVPGFNASRTANSSTSEGDNSPLAIYAVTALPLNDSEVALRMSLQAIRKAMAVPFNYFQSNFLHDGPSTWELKKPRSGLTKDMYTTLSISIVSHQVVAGKVSLWLFIIMSGSLLALSMVTIIATARICTRRPQRCGYPTLDFAAVCAIKGMPAPDLPAQTPGSGLHRSLTQLGQQPGKLVARRIKDERVVV